MVVRCSKIVDSLEYVADRKVGVIILRERTDAYIVRY